MFGMRLLGVGLDHWRPRSCFFGHGSVFSSGRDQTECDEISIKLHFAGTEAHSSLGAGETYNAPFRRVYLKLREEHRSRPKEVLLQIALHAMSTMASPNGITPCKLLYGRMPRYPAELSGDGDARTQEERMSVMNTAREEYLPYVCQA